MTALVGFVPMLLLIGVACWFGAREARWQREDADQ